MRQSVRGIQSAVTLGDGTTVTWREAGSGDPLLLIHGLGGWHWQAVVPLLARDHRVIAPYLRGFGGSTGAMDYRMEELAADMFGLVDHLGISSVDLVGHSLGGMVAQIIATERPALVRRLALVSTTSHTGRRAGLFARAMASLAERGAAEALHDPSLRRRIESVLAEAFPEGPPAVELLARGLDDPSPAVAAAWNATSTFSRKDRLGEIRGPVLVAHGTNDLLIPFRLGEWIHQAIPHSEMKRFEAGHSLQISRPGDLAEALLDFLEG